MAAKSTKNSPTDAFACFVPANVRNGRLFAGAHAPLPRFLPLLAGPSFDGSGIESESCAANGVVREGATTGSETQNPAIAPGSGFKPPHYRLQRKKSGVKAERVKTGPVCSQRRPAGESKACFAEPPQSKRRIPLRRKPAKAPVLAQPNSDPAKATCGWFWVPFATKRYKTPCGDSRETFAL